MSAATVTCRRTLSRARNYLTTALAVAGCLAISSLVFVFRLFEAEGSYQELAVIWATSLAPCLPVLAAFLAMDVWSEERKSGRLDLLLSVAVRERDYCVGKTLGVWLLMVMTTVLSLVVMFVDLALFAPSALVGVRLVYFVPALFVLFLQGAFWCAASVALSAMFRSAFAAATTAVVLLAALPRGLWHAARLWAPSGGTTFGEMPFDAQVADFSSGVLSTGAVCTYAVLTVAAVFVASKAIVMTRFSGSGTAEAKGSNLLAIAAAAACALSVSSLAFRLDVTLDVPVGHELSFSPRLHHILAEASGEVSVSVFLPRRDPAFRPAANYLRALKRRAEAVGGLTMNLSFVDPTWDIGAAERLFRLGVRDDAIVFENGRRLVALPLADGYRDSQIASAIQSVTMPPQRRGVYWTVGHDEVAFDDYGTFGMSDIARELAASGYVNRKLELASGRKMPDDCALVVIAGARRDFSRLELQNLETYLKSGGRLLVLTRESAKNGVSSLLHGWGIICAKALPLAGKLTMSGFDVVVSDFPSHPITADLGGSRLILERPLALKPSAAVGGGDGADRLAFAPIARVDSTAVVAGVERGVGVGSDLDIRPTRLVVIGDHTFVMNGQLKARANANRDFFLNVIAYLSGTDALGASGAESNVLVVDLDRASRRRFALVAAGVMPGAVFLVLTAVTLRRRRRK